MKPTWSKTRIEHACRLLVSGELIATFSTYAIQWALYLNYKAHNCSVRPFVVRVRQVSLCLSQEEARFWKIVDTAVWGSFASVWATVGVLMIGDRIAGYIRQRREADAPTDC